MLIHFAVMLAEHCVPGAEVHSFHLHIPDNGPAEISVVLGIIGHRVARHKQPPEFCLPHMKSTDCLTLTSFFVMNNVRVCFNLKNRL